MLSTDEVDVQVVDRLATFFAFVDDSAVAINHTLLFCDSSSLDEHVSEKSGMLFFSLTNTRKSISVLRNHQEMVVCNWESVLFRIRHQ